MLCGDPMAAVMAREGVAGGPPPAIVEMVYCWPETTAPANRRKTPQLSGNRIVSLRSYHLSTGEASLVARHKGSDFLRRTGQNRFSDPWISRANPRFTFQRIERPLC